MAKATHQFSHSLPISCSRGGEREINKYEKLKEKKCVSEVWANLSVLIYFLCCSDMFPDSENSIKIMCQKKLKCYSLKWEKKNSMAAALWPVTWLYSMKSCFSIKLVLTFQLFSFFSFIYKLFCWFQHRGKVKILLYEWRCKRSSILGFVCESWVRKRELFGYNSVIFVVLIHV